MRLFFTLISYPSVLSGEYEWELFPPCKSSLISSHLKLCALTSGSWRNPPSFMEPEDTLLDFLRHEAKCYCNLLAHDVHVNLIRVLYILRIININRWICFQLLALVDIFRLLLHVSAIRYDHLQGARVTQRSVNIVVGKWQNISWIEHICINMRIKPTSAYKVREFIIYVETVYMFSATVREVLYQGLCITKISQALYKYKILSCKYMV